MRAKKNQSRGRVRALLLGGGAASALAAFGCGADPAGTDAPAIAGTACSGLQSGVGCNSNHRVAETCWTGGMTNAGMKGSCVGPYVMERPNVSAPPVNNALCTCKVP